MDDLTDIKDLWLAAKVDALPSAAETIRFIRRYRFRQVVKKAALVGLLLAMAFLMLRAVIDGSATLASRLGELLIGVGYVVLIFSNLNSLKRAVSQFGGTNREFVEYLKQGLCGRLYFYEKTQPATFAVMTLGIFLYVFDMVRENFALLLAVYAVLAAALAVLWLVVRPRINEKRIAKLRATIARLEGLQDEI